MLILRFIFLHISKDCNGGVSGRGGLWKINFCIFAFADHLQAQKHILHTTGKGKSQKHKRASLTADMIYIDYADEGF